MQMTKFFTDQLNREVAMSLKVLQRVPEGRNDWKPHERSMPMGYLAALVAQMPAWIALMLTTTEFNLSDKASSGNFQVKGPESSEALLKLADESAAKAPGGLIGCDRGRLERGVERHAAWQDAEERSAT